MAATWACPYIQDQEARDLESKGKRERRGELFLPAREITHICGSKDRRQGQRIEQPCEQPPSTRYTRAKRGGAGITGFRDVRLSKRLNYQDLRSSFRLSLFLSLFPSFFLDPSSTAGTYTRRTIPRRPVPQLGHRRLVSKSSNRIETYYNRYTNPITALFTF